MSLLPTDASTIPEAPITYDLSKPLAATEDISVGQVIFYESAFVTSVGPIELEGEHEEECEDSTCPGCERVANLEDDEQEEMSAAAVEEWGEINEYWNTMEIPPSAEVRKHLCKLFHTYEMDSTSLNELLTLPIHEDESNMTAAVGLREAHPAVVPPGLSDDQVVQLIGVLDRYCIPLEEINSTGLFLYVSSLQHSCTPNASFTDAEDALWVTAIKPIAAGEVVTVDFFNLYYSSRADRAEVLEGMHLTCSCDLCLGLSPDRTRAFKCKNESCTDGIVHPTGDVFACTTCGATWDNEAIDAVSKEEIRLMNELIIYTRAELENIIAASPLHRHHYIFYRTFINFMDEAVDEDMPLDQGLEVYKGLLASLNYVVDYPHAQKIHFLNHMAQTCILMEDIELAKSYYEQAYAMSCLVFGETCGETRMFQRFVEHTPQNVAEMREMYGHEDTEDEEEEEEEDDGEEPSVYANFANVQ
ncbi:hypothetical protein LEN26_020600 [Aphanomyces euteiches]|nr:hypothetical protein LEN26_020600 [Aphanomyces euteiches]KAH9108370.1 hypothetical protein AeMF1_016457 [Aphanomyces euteiches]KAH9184093.1 hypothetical protein AeNC1_013930 [Aphanomyces euteiches]